MYLAEIFHHLGITEFLDLAHCLIFSKEHNFAINGQHFVICLSLSIYIYKHKAVPITDGQGI
jgi:hypothetical protein